MELGSGLTLQTTTVGNKTTSGIYFLPSNKADPKNAKKKTHDQTTSRMGVHRTQSTKAPHQAANKKVLREKVVRNASTKQPHNGGAKPGSGNSRRNPKVTTAQPHSPNGMKENIPKSKQQQQRQQNKTYNANSNNSNNKTLHRQQQQSNTNQVQGDPSYVTLTQDQLNTILSLVKTKHEIDVSDIINVNKDDDSGEIIVNGGNQTTTGKPGSGTSVRSRLSKNSASSRRTAATNGGGVLGLLQAAESNEVNVPGLTLDDQESQLQGERVAGSTAAESEIPPQPNEQQKPANQIYTYSGTLIGLGSRDQDKEKLERNRKQWVEDLKAQMERKRIAKKDLKAANLNEHEVTYFGHDHNKQPVSARRSAMQEGAEYQNVKAASTEPSAAAAAATQIQSDSHLHNMNGNLPSAMRSSFFIGESAPRTNAFSAKKREDQQRWREELQKQVEEQKEKKASNKQRRQQQELKPEDEDLWFRHFDTMQPQASRIESPREQLASPRTQASTNDAGQLKFAEASHQPVRDDDLAIDPMSSVSRDGTISPGNHLRKMTSLLDPAEKDAIKVRRQKQEEHRRAIAEQVAERKRAKEEQERLRKVEEEEEERRLNQDRINLKKQFEREKISHQEKEELRDKKTRELYQQMQEAKASGLREKFEKRQKSLRRKGHDTTRLEKTYRSTLDTKTLNAEVPEANAVPPLNLNQVGVTPVASQHKEDDVVRSARVIQITSDHRHPQPISATLSDQGGAPIRLEISLSNSGSHSLNGTKEISVQTDFNSASHHNASFMSDTGTEYIPLPVSRKGRQQPPSRNKSPRRKTSHRDLSDHHQVRFDQNNLYDKYARQDGGGGGAGKKNKEKPKWGVGAKKKQYKSASQKYVGGSQWKEKHDENMKRREEQLLAQQALNERHLLVGKSSKTSISSSAPEKKSSSQSEQQNRYRSKKNDGGSRRQRDVPTDHHSPTDHRHVDSGPQHSDRQHTLTVHHRSKHFDLLSFDQRPMSVTTQEAKYDANKHSRSSPVPDTTNDFVEYRRSDVILNPNQPQSRPDTSSQHISIYDGGMDNERPISSMVTRKPSDPLIDGSVVKQRERQDRILKEISILRHGLLLKQREVASYPAVIPSTSSVLLNKNPGDVTASD